MESGTRYTLECDAKQVGQQYTSLKLAMLGSDYAALASEELPINTTSFAPYSTQVTAPASSRYGTVVVYSEALGNFDSCSVVVN